MKILTIERDNGSHVLNYRFGQVEGNNPNAEGYEEIETGSIRIADNFEYAKLERLKSDADLVREVKNWVL